MKNTNSFQRLILAFISLFILTSAIQAQNSKPEFYTDNGATKVTSGIVKTFKKTNDLQVKTSLPDTLFKYDKVSFFIRVYHPDKKTPTDEVQPCACGPDFRITYTKKQFDKKYQGQTETSLWVFNPTGLNGKGDFYSWCPEYCAGCGWEYSRPQLFFLYLYMAKTVRITFDIVGYTITGEKEVWHKDQNAFIKEPTYDDGVVIVKSDEVIMK